MIYTFKAVTLLTIFCVSFNIVGAQHPSVVVKKTSKIETYNDTQYYVHVVRSGQTLYSISRVYDTPIDDIVKINPGLSSDLKPGQVVKIPVVKGEAPELKVIPVVSWDTTKFTGHRVLKGETLYGLSKLYDTPIAVIQKANDGLPGGLKTGSVLLIPKKQEQEVSKVDAIVLPEVETKEPADDQRPVVVLPTNNRETVELNTPDTTYFDHEVQRRETLYGVSRMYQVSMDQIIKSNPFLKERKLQKGDVLRVPQYETVVASKPDEDAAAKFIDHKVLKDETLWSLSQSYNVTVEDILAANPDARKGIKRRKILRIPVYPRKPAETVALDKPAGAVGEVEAGNTVVKITEATKMCAESKHNKEFQIALMLPLYLDSDNSENHIDSRSLRFLDYYKGTRMAVDSLAAMGMKINLKVYDVDNSQAKIHQALSDSELENADLIIGPLFRSSFFQVAEFAKQHDIHIVNPLTTDENVIRNNPSVFKVQVPEEIHLKLIAHSVRKHYPESNIVLVRHNPYQDKERADAIKNALKGKLKDRILLPNSYLFNLLVEKSYNDENMHDGELFDTINIENTLFKEDFLNDEIMSYTIFPNKIHDLIYSNDTIYGFTKYSSLARKNIFVSLTDNKVFTMEVLSRLNSLKDTFDLSVYTLPEVMEYELETDFLSSMDMHISGSGYLDFGGERFENFESSYYYRWGHFPNNHVYACLAYDIGMYFGSALYRFGTAFDECLPNHQYESLYMNFFFVRQPGHGYENGFASIYRIHDYHFIPEEELFYSGE